MSNFQIIREEMKSQADMKIINSNPVVRKVQWIGRFQLQYGMIQHADLQYSKVELTDLISWFQFGNPTVYTYYLRRTFSIA